MPPSGTINPNLWDIARKQLTTAEEAQLAKAVVDNNNLTEQLLELVQEKKQQCMDRRWKFKRSNGDVIVIRDVFEKVVRWIQKFIAVRDVAIQYDPVHAALPWAGVRMLLQVAVNDTETLAAVAEGIEMISYHIGRCAIYERLYLVPHNLPVRTERTLLQNALISFYASILEWLSKAGVYYAMSTRRRSLSAVVSPTPTLAEITKQEQRITQLATSLQDQLISDMSGVLNSLDASFHDLMKLLREFEQPIVRIIGTLDLIESNIKAEEQTRLATWLSKQLAFLGPSRGVHHSVWDEFTQRVKNAQGLEPAPLSLVDCRELITMVTADCPVIIIIDGLDEAEGDVRDLFDTLQHTIKESQNILKLFVSSRDHTPVEAHLQNVASIRITHVDNAKDISTFVKTKVDAAVQYKRLLRGKVSPALETRVIQTLIQGSGEMFLWASLNLEQLCGSEFEVEADVKDELEALRTPKSLLETLEQMYKRVQTYKPKAKQITTTVFGWLLVSERQLSNTELLGIVLSTMNLRMGELDAEEIQYLCRGFINSDNEFSSFTLAHESIRKYLQEQDEFCLSKLHFRSFTLCLRCLTARYEGVNKVQVDEPDMTPTSESLQNLIEKVERKSTDGESPSFWQYAVCYWLRHYTKTADQDIRLRADQDLLQFIFDYGGSKFLEWQREMLRLLEDFSHDEKVQNISLVRELSSLDATYHPAIFLASVYGLSIILAKLHLESPQLNWSEKNNHGASALYLSSVNGHDGILRHLLERGVDPNVIGGHFRTPIQGAAFNGHLSAVEILLSNGADPLLGGLVPTALHAAIAGGHEPVIQLLVGNDLCHEAARLGSLIETGFHYGQQEAVMSLLQHYFTSQVKLKELQDEAITGTRGALQAALYENRNDTRILHLSDKISDVNESGGLFGNPLQAASFAGSARWVRLLLERGADPNSIGYCGSALRAASFGGHDEVVCLVLERGAILGPEDRDALEACALKDRLSTLSLLIGHFKLEKISDYNECKRHFSAAMRTARRNGRDHLVTYMIQHGAGLLGQDLLEDMAEYGSMRNGSSRYGVSLRYAQSSYAMSSNTGGRSQQRYASYTSVPGHRGRFYAIGQPTDRSRQLMKAQMQAWDKQWSSASGRR
ncbi:ankyrin repeat protein [Colletotrichum kahawae]|uniref:Ankyrin repeat protein n=1 Tax=Colletotrichum kahawae TaxID=34407 RepID=A0AAE0DCA0_COLKA|nr:ankyrin repeat protein [Colletotrichum kahawae]